MAGIWGSNHRGQVKGGERETGTRGCRWDEELVGWGNWYMRAVGIGARWEGARCRATQAPSGGR